MIDALTTIRAIVFDFGGVFTHSTVSRARLRDYDEQLGLPPDTLHNTLFAGEAWELASTGRITQEDFWARVGRPYESRLPSEFRTFRQGMFWAEPVDEEVVELARQLQHSYPLALCSNALPELDQILARRPDIRALFGVKVISVHAGLRKPDPAIFHLTAQRLGMPLEACLLIDDKPRNTQAAEALGMQAIVYRSVAQLKAALAARGLLPRG